MSSNTVCSSKMGVDAKRIQVCALRIFRFSFNICSKFVIKHPLISSVLLLLLIFYFFLPKAFLLLIYSCPFLSCTYVFIRFYWHSQRKNDRKVAKKSDGAPPKVMRKDGKSVRRTHTRSSSSRIMEVKTRELGSDAVSDERKLKIADDDPVIGGVVTTTEEEKLDGSIVAAGKKIEELRSDFTSNQSAKSDCGSKVETEISTSEDEEAKESRNKAVEWNEDDQKNLMDLGLSELERNKRLESLIARRRARKLYKAYTDKNLTNSAINASNSFLVAPVSIARCNTFDVPNTPDLLIPGSAPSILLQRNPFDLPYDPFEEKPNLMADSFQQEFMPAQQKEIMFCRHESFTLGSFYPFPTTHNEHDFAGQSGFKRHLDEANSDRVVRPPKFEGGGTLRPSLSATDLVIREKVENSKQRNSQPEEIEEAGSSRIGIKGETVENTEKESCIHEGSRAQGGTEANKQNKCESSSSSLPENDEQAARAKKATNLTHLTTSALRFPESPTPSSGPCPLPRGRTVNEISYLASPATIDRSTLENHLLYTNSGPWHTPNDSIASDMQVEVSEVGSPPLTGDGSASSNDGDSLTYDGDAEKEITSSSDEMWGVSPRATRIEEKDLTSREVNELSEDHISRGFLVHQKEPQHSVFQLPQQHQTNSYCNISNELQDSVEGTDLQDSSISYTSPQEEKMRNLQESRNFSETSADEVNINYNLDVPVSAYDDLEDEKLVEVKCEHPETSTISEIEHTISKAAGEIISELSNHRESMSLSSRQSVEEVSITYSTDVPAPTGDDLEDLKSVEASVPETSILEVSHNLSEPADKINSECSNHTENKSLHSSNQAIEKVSIAETIDAPVQTYDELGYQKSVKVASDLPETSIISEIAHDLSDLADEINSGCSNHTESKSLNSVDQATEEVSITDTNDASVTTYDDLGGQKSVEVANDVLDYQAIEDHIVPTIKEEQSIIQDENLNKGKESSEPSDAVINKQSMSEFDVPGISQNSSDPSASDIQQWSTDEQVTSSPKSVLRDMVELPPTSSDLNPHMQTGVSESDMEENIGRDKLLDQQLPESSSLTPQNEQHEIVASADNPSTECNSQNSPEMSDTLGKTIDKAREMLHINEAVHDEAKKPISNEASVELSNLPDEIEPRSVEHIEGTSGNLSEYDSSIQQTKPEEVQSEFENLTDHRNAASPSKHAVEGDHVCMRSTVGEEALLQNSTALAEEMSCKDQFRLISENESEGIDESSNIKEIQKFTEDHDNSVESMQGTESKSRNLTEDAVGTKQLDRSGGVNNPNGKENSESPAVLHSNDSSKDTKSESKELTENGNEINNVTIIDEVKAPTSEAP